SAAPRVLPAPRERAHRCEMVKGAGDVWLHPGRSIWPIWRLCPVAYATRAAANCAILETPTFRRLAARNRLEHAPAREVIRRQPRQIVLSAPLRMGSQTPF